MPADRSLPSKRSLLLIVLAAAIGSGGTHFIPAAAAPATADPSPNVEREFASDRERLAKIETLVLASDARTSSLTREFDGRLGRIEDGVKRIEAVLLQPPAGPRPPR